MNTLRRNLLIAAAVGSAVVLLPAVASAYDNPFRASSRTTGLTIRYPTIRYPTDPRPRPHGRIFLAPRLHHGFRFGLPRFRFRTHRRRFFYPRHPRRWFRPHPHYDGDDD